MEKSSIEILKDIAKRAGWEIEINEKEQHFRAGNTLRRVIIKNNSIRDSYFISFQGDYFDKYRLYSGVFFPVEGYRNYSLLIKNRNVLDKISFRKNRNRLKIGNSSFDANLNIETNNEIETHKLLRSSNVQIEMVQFMKKQIDLCIGFNEMNPNFMDDLKEKSYLSLFVTTEWMLEKEMIDEAFKLGELLRSKLN